VPERLASVEDVAADPPYLFTVENSRGEREEAILVPCEGGVEAWINRCTHEAARLERGRGGSVRDGEIVCPKHGSLFDACDGDCDNGPAAGMRLLAVAVTVNRGYVFLTDDDYAFVHEGGIDDGGGPDSTSHLRF
jgi:nitrite reductase/ring-hydroxylating ferredoxin subunit